MIVPYGWEGRQTPRSLTSACEFVAGDLPIHNQKCLQNPTHVHELMQRAQAIVTAVVTDVLPLLPGLDGNAAIGVLQPLGFLMSSVERHLQEQGQLPGAAVKQLGVGGFLAEVAVVAGTPPRDGIHTYWWCNRDHRYSFTGEAGERLFATNVNLTHELYGKAADAIEPIAAGAVQPDAPEAAEQLRYAASEAAALVASYKGFTKNGADGRPGMTPEFFLVRMRPFLCSYPVIDGGEELNGPNAVNEVSQMRVDILGGWTDDWYHGLLANTRQPYLRAAEWASVQRAINGPSVIDQICHELDVQQHELTGFPRHELRKRVAARGMIDTIRAYGDLFAQVNALSKLHGALLRHFVVRGSKELSEEIRNRLPVSTEEGVSGSGLDVTMRIIEMRCAPSIDYLVRTVRED